MDLSIIDNLMERLEIRKKIMSGNRSTEDWCRAVNVLNSNHEDALRGYFNMLSEEDQLTTFSLMMENKPRYAEPLLLWFTFMSDWQITATSFLT